MTLEKLSEIMKEHNIPGDVRLMSDSGWECDATDMDGIFYNKKENILVFTQEGNANFMDEHYYNGDWELLCGTRKEWDTEEFTECDECYRLKQCIAEGFVTEITKPLDEHKHYWEADGKECPVYEEYMDDILKESKEDTEID